DGRDGRIVFGGEGFVFGCGHL
ncbi:MAG: hypothetical protein QOF76_5698, partial [Solirubrobacteraceae bacterium]|nr:hypothetical protein [Solirubrobacteraceae bacterium]